MSAGAFEDDGDAVIEMDLLPPRWLDVQDEVTEYLTEITKQTRKLEQLHQKHVLPGFDDEDVKRREEREIEQFTQEITRGFQNCQKAIKRIERMVQEAQQNESISNGEEVMARNLRISLATRVGEASTLFRKKQSAYLKKLKVLGGLSPGTASPMPNASYSLADDPSLLDSDADKSLGQHALLQAQQQLRQNPNDVMITQREREIEDIAKSIIDLSNIFQEIQTMVIDQGSMLDRIDYNVERMNTDVKEAAKELKVASGYQRRSIKRKIMLLLVIIIAGMFILLGLKLNSRGNSAPAPRPPPIPERPPAQQDNANPDASVFLRASSQDSQASQAGPRRLWRRRKRKTRRPRFDVDEQF